MAVLIGMSGSVAGKHIELDRSEVSIGRTDANTIELDDPAVSGAHCSVLRLEDGYFIRDNGSTNGTRLNNRTITEQMRLRPKDIIRVGSVEFLFDSEEIGGDRSSDMSQTEVEVTPGPAAVPDSFSSISPFGARGSGEKGKGLWYVLIIGVAILALAAVVLLFVKLVTAV